MKRSTACWKLFYVNFKGEGEENGKNGVEGFLEEDWGEQRLEV
jgi:hypothetical protein